MGAETIVSKKGASNRSTRTSTSTGTVPGGPGIDVGFTCHAPEVAAVRSKLCMLKSSPPGDQGSAEELVTGCMAAVRAHNGGCN